MWKGSIFPGFIGFYICFVRGKHRAIIVDIVERLSKLGKALKICGEKVKNLWKKRNRNPFFLWKSHLWKTQLSRTFLMISSTTPLK